MLANPDLNNGNTKIILKYKVKNIFTVTINQNFSDNLYITLHNTHIIQVYYFFIPKFSKIDMLNGTSVEEKALVSDPDIRNDAF